MHHDLAPGEQTRDQTGREGLKNFFGSVVFPGLSNFNTAFEDIIGEKDLVAARWQQSVTQSGVWLGRPPSNKRTTIGGISIVRIRYGLIVEEWEVRDTAALLLAFNVISLPKPLEAAVLRTNGASAAVPVSRILTGGPMAQPGASAAQTPTLDHVKAVATQFVGRILNDGNIAAADRLASPSLIDHDRLAGQGDGVDGVKQFASRFKASFPDSTVIPDITLASGDTAVVRWTASGTQQGTFLGVPATGRQIRVSGINFLRVSNGQVVEKWGNWPVAETLRQLGIIQYA